MDNYHKQFPANPLMNRRARLRASLPAVGSDLVTYAYPENEILDFGKDGDIVIASDYFSGHLLDFVENGPYMPYAHLHTSLEIRDGASGGPVFNEGFVVGVNSRSWKFQDEGDNLSSVVPIKHLLSLAVDLWEVPECTWEFSQVPTDLRGIPLPVEVLAAFGHIDLTY